MKQFADPHLQLREKVNVHFQSHSLFWKDIYASTGVYAEIYRDRQAAVLAWIDSLALTPGSRVLEIGCGAGFMAVALAQRGFRVHAIDSVEAMVEQARGHAAESGATGLLSLDIGDVYDLAFEDGSFDLVIALGVIPWLERPELAMQEMARVTRPGGHVILTADNRARLNHLLDPWLNPGLAPLIRSVKAMLERVGLRQPPEEAGKIFYNFHSSRFIDVALAHVELVKIRGMALGFGPFSLRGRRVLPEPLGIILHHRLQRLADRNAPVLRSTGAQYIVLARKSPSRPLAGSTDTEKIVSGATKAL